MGNPDPFSSLFPLAVKDTLSKAVAEHTVMNSMLGCFTEFGPKLFD